MSEPLTQAEFWNTKAGVHWAEFADRYDEILGPFGDAVLEAADIREGMRVLDVGCGNGALTIEAARRTGPAGVAIGVDLSAPMLARAKVRADGANVRRAEFVQADAQVYDVDDAAFDRVISRFGVMFFEDPTAAFANLRRVTKPGGRMAFACWQDAGANEWIMVPGLALVEHVGMPELGEPGAAGSFAFAEADRLRSVLGEVGWTEVVVDPLEREQRFGADVEETLDFLSQTDIAQDMIASASPETVEAGFASVRQALAPYERVDGLFLKGSAWLVTATA